MNARIIVAIGLTLALPPSAVDARRGGGGGGFRGGGMRSSGMSRPSSMSRPSGFSMPSDAPKSGTRTNTGPGGTTRTPVTLVSSRGVWTLPDPDPVTPGLQAYVEGGAAQFSLVTPLNFCWVSIGWVSRWPR